MGYTAECWAQLPEAVRELVDEYNSHSSGSAGRAVVVQRLVEQPALRREVEAVLDGTQRKARRVERGR